MAKMAKLDIRIPEEELELLKRAAADAGTDLSKWVRQITREAAISPAELPAAEFLQKTLHALERLKKDSLPNDPDGIAAAWAETLVHEGFLPSRSTVAAWFVRAVGEEVSVQVEGWSGAIAGKVVSAGKEYFEMKSPGSGQYFYPYHRIMRFRQPG